MRRLLLLGMILWLVASAQAATTRYVDVNSIGGPCNDGNPGTSITAPKCSAVNAINATTAPGDILYFRAGTYSPSRFDNFGGGVTWHSGSSGNPITFKNYQN